MSTFSVTRTANGQTVISLQNLQNYSVKDVGTMTGNVQLSLGKTTDDETILKIDQSSDAGSLVLQVDDTKNNLEFDGKNINAEFNKKNTNGYNVAWNASNSTLDSTKSNSSVIVETGKESNDNLIKLGTSSSKLLSKYDNVIFDNGKNNIYTASDTSTTRVETSATSNGAVVKAGNGLNDFYIGGSAGVFVGGSSVDKYTTYKNTAKQNMMLGKDGNDEVSDYGEYSLFVGGTGKDAAYLYGKHSIANLGFDEDGTFKFEDGSLENSVFKGETQTDADGNVYDYKTELKKHGWSATDFLAKSDINNNPYYSLIKKEIEETLG